MAEASDENSAGREAVAHRESGGVAREDDGARDEIEREALREGGPGEFHGGGADVVPFDELKITGGGGADVELRRARIGGVIYCRASRLRKMAGQILQLVASGAAPPKPEA